MSLPTVPQNILLNPERSVNGEDYKNVLQNQIPAALNRLEQLIAQTNTLLNSRLPPYRGAVTIGAAATAFNIVHNLGILAPFTANVAIWNASSVQIDNSIFTGSTFTTDEVDYTMTAGALGAGTYTVLVLA